MAATRIVAGAQRVGLVVNGPRAARPFSVSDIRWIWVSKPPELRGRSSKVVASP